VLPLVHDSESPVVVNAEVRSGPDDPARLPLLVLEQCHAAVFRRVPVFVVPSGERGASGERTTAVFRRVPVFVVPFQHVVQGDRAPADVPAERTQRLDEGRAAVVSTFTGPEEPVRRY